MQLTLVALACYSSWISATCESQTCGYADSHVAVQAALILAIICYTWHLVNSVMVFIPLCGKKKQKQDSGNDESGWITAAISATRFSVPSAVAGVVALWMALHSGWSCGSMEVHVVVGIVHLLGSALVLAAVLFSGDGTSRATVVRAAMVAALV